MSESSRSSLSPPLSAVGDMMPNETVDIQIYVPFLAVQKRIEVNLNDTVWSVKQSLLSNLTQVIPEGFNYGLFLPPCNGRAGKFLVDDRIFRDYPFNDCPPYLELKYKKRVYKSFNIDTKVYKRLHSKHSLKRFIDLCEKREAKKVESLCQIGLDPNFHGIHGETPLTWAASSDNNRDLIVALVAGGAHLDFRNLKSETPLHKAVFNVTSANVKLLLDLGASAQCRDIRSLTPLYYACSRAGNNPDVAEMLLRDFADTGVTDTQGNTELHQACRNGLVGHLEHLLFYGADVDCQNLSGNTPVHTSVINNQASCAKLLLFRNANPALYNRAGQTPYHVAIKIGSKELMQLFSAHEPQKAVPYRRPPRYNSKRRLTLSRAFLTQNRRKSISLFDQYSISEYGTINRTNDSFTNKLINNDESMSEIGGAYSPPSFSRQRRRQSPLYDIVERMRINSSNSVNEVIETQNCDEETDTVECTTKPQHDRRFSQPIHFDQLKIIGCPKPKEDYKRIIVIPRSPDNGFGFILRGAKKIETGTHFEANDQVPSLQFFEEIDEGGMAAKAGLLPGDFLLEVNGIDVRRWTHDQVVQLINACTEIITIKVITVENSDNNYAVSKVCQNKVISTANQKSVYETKTLPFKRCSASSSNISNLTAFDDSFPICSSFSVLPSTFKDPRSKVASVRNRAVNRRISAADLEILMVKEKRNVENEEKSPKPQSNTQCKPVPSPKVYSSVAAMKRSSAPQPLKTGSTSTLSSASSPSDQERLSTFESNSNLSLILDEEDNKENSRRMSTGCPEESNRHNNKLRKVSIRPKTPPPPPPTCENTVDDVVNTGNISHVENSNPTTSFGQSPFIKEKSRFCSPNREKLEPSTGDFAMDLKNALAKRRQKMGESSGNANFQHPPIQHESDNNQSQASSLTLSPPSARGGENASTNAESDNHGQTLVTLEHAVTGSVAATSTRDSGYTSSRNSLEKSECSSSSSSYSNNSEKDEEKAISRASVSDDDVIVTSFSSTSPSLWAAKSVDRWTVEEVGFWLDSLYLSEYKRNFLRAEVDGARLLDFCRADFAKMGLTRIAHRLTIENALKSRKRFSPDSASRRLL